MCEFTPNLTSRSTESRLGDQKPSLEGQGGSLFSIGEDIPESAKKVEALVQDLNRGLEEEVRKELQKQGAVGSSPSRNEVLKAATIVAHRYVTERDFEKAIQVSVSYCFFDKLLYERIASISIRKNGIDKTLEFANQINSSNERNNLLIAIAERCLKDGDLEKGKVVIDLISVFCVEKSKVESLLEKKCNDLLKEHVIKGEFEKAGKIIPLIKNKHFAFEGIKDELMNHVQKKVVRELIKDMSPRFAIELNYEENKRCATEILNARDIHVTERDLGGGEYGLVYEGREGENDLAIKFLFYPVEFRLDAGEALALFLPKKKGFQRTNGLVLYHTQTETYHYIDRFNAFEFIPKQLQKLEFCQSQRPRFNLIEAAPIQMDRCDAEEVKGGDVGEGKNQLLKLFGYNLGEYQIVATVSKKRPGVLKKTCLTKKEWVELAYHLVQGVRNLSQLGLMHNDLHPGNIFFAHPKEGKSMRVKIADFGNAYSRQGGSDFECDWMKLALLLREVIKESQGNIDSEDPEIQSFLDAVDSREESKILGHPLIQLESL